MQQAAGAAPPAQAVQDLRPHADRRSLRRQGRAVPEMRHAEPGARRRLRHLRPHRRAEAEVRRRRVPGARHDLRRAAEGDHPAGGLEQGPGDRGQDHPRHQGAGGLFRRHPADDRQRHVHHQRHRARDRVAAAPLAGGVLPLRGQDALHRADHPVSRLVGGVRVQLEESALRAHRPQAQVPRHGVPARARAARRRRDHPRLPPGRSHQPAPTTPAAGRWATASSACAPSARSRRARCRSARARRSPRRTSTPCASAGIEEIEVADEALRRRLHRLRHRRSGHRRGAARGQRAGHRARDPQRAGEERRSGSRCSSPSATRSGRSCRRR